MTSTAPSEPLKGAAEADDGAVTPDGCPVELYALFPPMGEAELIHAAVGGIPSTVLELGCGTGRMLRPLAVLGHDVLGLDQSPAMLAHLAPLPGVCASIERADLGRTFDVVVLPSHLVNTPDPAARAAFLAAARRHVSPDGVVIIQWFTPAWFDEARERRRTVENIGLHLHNLYRDGPLLSATMTYTVARQTWHHTFTTRCLSEKDLADELSSARLCRDRWLDERRNWFAARPI